MAKRKQPDFATILSAQLHEAGQLMRSMNKPPRHDRVAVEQEDGNGQSVTADDDQSTPAENLSPTDASGPNAPAGNTFAGNASGGNALPDERQAPVDAGPSLSPARTPENAAMPPHPDATESAGRALVEPAAGADFPDSRTGFPPNIPPDLSPDFPENRRGFRTDVQERSQENSRATYRTTSREDCAYAGNAGSVADAGPCSGPVHASSPASSPATSPAGIPASAGASGETASHPVSAASPASVSAPAAFDAPLSGAEERSAPKASPDASAHPSGHHAGKDRVLDGQQPLTETNSHEPSSTVIYAEDRLAAAPINTGDAISFRQTEAAQAPGGDSGTSPAWASPAWDRDAEARARSFAEAAPAARGEREARTPIRPATEPGGNSPAQAAHPVSAPRHEAQAHESRTHVSRNDFAGTDFPRTDLSRPDLSRTDFSQTGFSQADFSQADFSRPRGALHPDDTPEPAFPAGRAGEAAAAFSAQPADSERLSAAIPADGPVSGSFPTGDRASRTDANRIGANHGPDQTRADRIGETSGGSPEAPGYAAEAAGMPAGRSPQGREQAFGRVNPDTPEWSAYGMTVSDSQKLSRTVIDSFSSEQPQTASNDHEQSSTVIHTTARTAATPHPDHDPDASRQSAPSAPRISSEGMSGIAPDVWNAAPAAAIPHAAVPGTDTQFQSMTVNDTRALHPSFAGGPDTALHAVPESVPAPPSVPAPQTGQATARETAPTSGGSVRPGFRKPLTPENSPALAALQEAQPGGARQKILDVLDELRQQSPTVTVNLKRLAEVVGLSYGTVRNTMSRLVHEGTLYTTQVRTATAHGVCIEFPDRLPLQGVATPGGHGYPPSQSVTIHDSSLSQPSGSGPPSAPGTAEAPGTSAAGEADDFWGMDEELISLLWPNVYRAGFGRPHLAQLRRAYHVQGWDHANVPRCLRYLDWELERAPHSERLLLWMRKMQQQGHYPRPEGYVDPEILRLQQEAEEQREREAALAARR